MHHRARSPRRRTRRGILTFEWILLISLLVIGIIGGLAAVRDALCSELDDLADCIAALNICECDDDDDDPEPEIFDFTDPEFFDDIPLP